MTSLRTACLKFAGPLALALTIAALPPARSSAQSAPAAPSSPSSPNGKILFQSTQGSDGYVNEIYTMEGDGKRQARLTYNEVDDAAPVWSPQGDRIAFLSDRGQGYDIYLMKADGSDERPLRDAEHGGPLLTNNLEWSPDGTRIMYAVGGKIYVVEVFAPGGDYSAAPPQNLSAAAPDYAFDNTATWSPDGSKIAFISNGCAGCFSDLYTMNADGTGRTQLTNTFEWEAEPNWSPAGGRLAYMSGRGGGRNAYVINADGTGDRVLTSQVGEAASPVWSPDGTRLAFGSSGPAALPRAGLYTMNADGTGLTFLTDQANGGGRVFWSPDGTRLVAHVVNDANWVDVITFEAGSASRHVTNLTKTRKADEYAWSWQRLPTP